MTFGEQPAKGDVVLHCGHVGKVPGQTHYYRSPLMFEYTRPNGSKGWARWIVCCAACHAAAGGDGYKVPRRGEAVWDGSVPRINAEQGGLP